MESSLVVQGLGFRAFITAAPVQSLIWELGSNVKLLHAVAKKRKKEKKKKKKRTMGSFCVAQKVKDPVVPQGWCGLQLWRGV